MLISNDSNLLMNEIAYGTLLRMFDRFKQLAFFFFCLKRRKGYYEFNLKAFSIIGGGRYLWHVDALAQLILYIFYFVLYSLKKKKVNELK